MHGSTSHLNSSAFSEARPGDLLATTKIKCGTMRIPRPGGTAMNCVGQDLLIENAGELAARRDDPLVTAVQAGVPEAFAQLHAIYSPRLYRTIIRITKNPDDAQDALQETFLRAHLNVHAFEGRSSIYSWLSRIAINSALMVLRKRRAHPEESFNPQPDGRCETIFFEPKDPALNPEEACDLHQRRVKTLLAIGDLNPTLQAPIRMQMKHGWSVKEISQALSISEAAVKSRLGRARRRLSIRRAQTRSVSQLTTGNHSLRMTTGSQSGQVSKT
jgi:RNA polymerase sigma-70 factor (ECF subfamily)